jgi:hypothetical protein
MSEPRAPSNALVDPMAAPPLDLGERPTKVRYGVLAFLAAMTFILYLDRSCINQAAPVIKKELGISETQKGHIFTAFALAYALFEIPAGRWGDRYGSRRILTDCALVVLFHGAHGSRGRIRIAGRHTIPVRCRRGGGVAELGKDLARVVSRVVARACPGGRYNRDAARWRRRVQGLAMAN